MSLQILLCSIEDLSSNTTDSCTMLDSEKRLSNAR